MLEWSTVDKEAHEARDRFNNRIQGLAFEETTGMPVLSQWVPPADAGVSDG